MLSETSVPEQSEPLVKLEVRRPNDAHLFTTEPMTRAKADAALRVFKYSFDRFKYKELKCEAN